MKLTPLWGTALAAVLMLAVAACSNVTPALTTAVQTALVDGAVCAADASKIGGKTVAVALAVATDPNCQMALNAMMATAGPSATVTVPTKP